VRLVVAAFASSSEEARLRFLRAVSSRATDSAVSLLETAGTEAISTAGILDVVELVKIEILVKKQRDFEKDSKNRERAKAFYEGYLEGDGKRSAPKRQTHTDQI
jgi:hypothetical protein